MTSASTQLGYSGYSQARAGSSLAASVLQGSVRSPAAGSFPLSAARATPPLRSPQAVQTWPSSAGNSTSVGLAKMNYAKVLDTRDSTSRVPQGASPVLPLRSIGNTLNAVPSPSSKIVRKVGSPPSVQYQGSLQPTAVPAKAPPRIISSFQVGTEPSRSHVACVASQPRVLAQPPAKSVHVGGLARTLAHASNGVPASPQATKFQWPRPDAQPTSAPTPVVLARRACESPYRGQHAWSPSALDLHSMPIASPSPMPTERTEIQSLVPSLSHRTTSPVPPDVKLYEASAVNTQDTLLPVTTHVDADGFVASLNVSGDDMILAETAAEDRPLQMVEPSTEVVHANIEALDAEVHRKAFENSEGGREITERLADELVQDADHNLDAYVLPQDAEILDEGLAPAPDEQHYSEVADYVDLSWAVAKDRHPLVSDEEATYVLDCLQNIRENFVTVGFGQVALTEGLCSSYEAVALLDPHDAIRILLERILQTYSRNGASETFVMAGTVYSTGYKKKLPLHVFPGDGMVPLSEQELQAKPATMTVIWPWDVKLEPDAQYS